MYILYVIYIIYFHVLIRFLKIPLNWKFFIEKSHLLKLKNMILDWKTHIYAIINNDCVSQLPVVWEYKCDLYYVSEFPRGKVWPRKINQTILMVKLVFTVVIWIANFKERMKLFSISLLWLCVYLSKFSLAFYKTYKLFSICDNFLYRKLIRYLFQIFDIMAFIKSRENFKELDSESVQLKIQ